MKKPPVRQVAWLLSWLVELGHLRAFGAGVAMVLQAVFVAHYLPVQFVDQLIDRRVQVLAARLREQIAAFDMDIAFSSLPALFLFLLFDAEDHSHIDHLVEMPLDAIEFLGDIAAQGWGDFKMMTADRQIHTTPPEKYLTVLSSNMPDRRQAPPLCAEFR